MGEQKMIEEQKLPEGILKIEHNPLGEGATIKVTIPHEPVKITTLLALLRYVEKMHFHYLVLQYKNEEIVLSIEKDY
jgi:hypothetical protein